MKNNVKKCFVLSISTLCLITNQIYCNTNNATHGTKYQPKTCCTPAHYRTFRCDTNKTEFLVKGDFLYWKSTLCGIEGAFGNTTITTVDCPCLKTTTLNQFDKRPDFKWRTGIQLGADLISNCFVLGTNWIHYHGYANYRENEQYGHWKVKYETADFTVGYNFYPCSHFCIKPFIGLRLLNMHQNLNSHLETLKIDQSEDPIEQTIITDINDEENFYGLGPKVGAEVDWYVGSNFSFYCMFDVVIYYGHVEGKYYNKDTLESVVENNNFNKDRCFNNLGTDGAIGIRFDKYTNRTFHLMLKIGLEHHRIYDCSKLGSDGSLSLDGGILEAGIGLHF